mmetsp:Transcript_24684/g.38093  ORF Transcript_24684/g.38093 Transcript_24684/m.38093 type:complete len:311 (+) Transcript_24684:394-1326(+)
MRLTTSSEVEDVFVVAFVCLGKKLSVSCSDIFWSECMLDTVCGFRTYPCKRLVTGAEWLGRIGIPRLSMEMPWASVNNPPPPRTRSKVSSFSIKDMTSSPTMSSAVWFAILRLCPMGLERTPSRSLEEVSVVAVGFENGSLVELLLLYFSLRAGRDSVKTSLDLSSKRPPPTTGVERIFWRRRGRGAMFVSDMFGGAETSKSFSSAPYSFRIASTGFACVMLMCKLRLFSNALAASERRRSEMVGPSIPPSRSCSVISSTTPGNHRETLTLEASGWSMTFSNSVWIASIRSSRFIALAVPSPETLMTSLQ